MRQRYVSIAAASLTALVVGVGPALAQKKLVAASSGTFPTTGGLFVGLLVGVILIMGGLTFFPALVLGPVAEHLAGGGLF